MGKKSIGPAFLIAGIVILSLALVNAFVAPFIPDFITNNGFFNLTATLITVGGLLLITGIMMQTVR